MCRRRVFVTLLVVTRNVSVVRSFFLRSVLTLTLAVPGHSSSVQFNGAKTYAVGSTPNAIAAADLNGDGRLDVVVANLSGTLSILLGNADGSFKTANTVTAGTQIDSVGAADLNGDTKPDLVITDRSVTSTQVGVVLNNGDGTFGSVQLLPGITSASSFAASDVNGDGKIDLVVGEISSSVVHVF